jgi:hypothetical protein
MRNDMKTLSKACNLLDGGNGWSGDRYRKKLVETIADEDFLAAVFKPVAGEGYTKADISAKLTQLYDSATKRSSIRFIAEAIDDYGYGNMNRASAAFLATLVNLGMATIDTKAMDLGRARDHDEISSREFDRNMEKLNEYQENLQQLLKYAKRIIKGKAKSLASKTGLPKDVCSSALFTVPGYEYVDQYKLGFYLKTVLGNLYGFVNYNPEEFEYEFEDVDWKTFFGVVFGKERIPDIASLILLEGVESINKYKNQRDVRACWDALTTFALKSLNQAPESIRDQMLELYLKRLNKMLADHNIDLRIDLRMVDDFRFENLANTVSKYKAKIDAVMGKARTLANARPETSPV